MVQQTNGAKNRIVDDIGQSMTRPSTRKKQRNNENQIQVKKGGELTSRALESTYIKDDDNEGGR
jgi:hypothetical protein